MYYLFFTCVEGQFRFLFLRGVGSWEGRGRIWGINQSAQKAKSLYVLNKIEVLRSCFLFISFVKHHQGVEAKL